MGMKPSFCRGLAALTLAFVTLGGATFAGAQKEPGPARTSDTELASYAELIPGFGGIYYDEQGRANVYLTDLSRADQVRDLGDDVQVVQGTYDFRQLLDWKAELRQLMTRSEIVMLDVDERTNRVVIGMDEDNLEDTRTAIDTLETEVVRLGVPSEAVIVTPVAPIRPLASLRDRVRPVPGGVQIAFGGFLCTHGFNTTRSGVTGFVTNSHCSGTQGGVQNTVIYQNTNSSSNRIGVEIADPTYFSGGACPFGRVCRYSDSAFIDYDSNSTSEFARIARTTSRSRTSGSLTISSSPRFTITNDQPFPVSGQELNKMGRTTGWTYGFVTNTCTDVNVAGTNITLLCQELVSGGSQGGDSGSPVFSYSGNDASLYGIVWGGSGTSTWAMSSFGNVEFELGNLIVSQATSGPASGSTLWLRADAGVTTSSGRVSTWSDQSGQGNHATMSISSRRPTLVSSALNGKPVLRFSGAQSLNLSSPVNSQSFTIFVVGKNSKSSGFSMILGPGGSAPNNQIRWENTTQALVVGTGNSLPTTIATIGDNRTYHALSVRYNGSTMTVYRDGNAVLSRSFTTSGPFSLNQIGAWFSTYFMQGDLAEVLVYGSSLSESARTTTNNYLKAKYGLP